MIGSASKTGFQCRRRRRKIHVADVRKVRDHFSALLNDVSKFFGLECVLSPVRMHLFPKCFQTYFQNVFRKSSVGVSVSGILCVCENLERVSK